MKYLKTIALLLLATLSLNAQDPKSKAILDKLSAKTKAYKTITAEFDWEILKKGKNKSVHKGKIQTKGNKYKLSIPGHTLYCDGNAVWDFMADMNEVQISEVEEESEDAISPLTIFTIYEKGFKYKFDSETATTQTINLYPANPDKRKFHTVKLIINKQKQEIASVIMMMKDGSRQTYTIKSFIGNASIADSDFTFSAAKHPGVSVEDMR